MKNILEEIIATRKETVEQLKQVVSLDMWKRMPAFLSKTKSLKKVLQQGNTTGIIAEFKRASPSKSIINNHANVEVVTNEYEFYGASALSILTEPVYFAGNNDDLMIAATDCNIPILRKDFIFDEYQVVESKALGADVILLIAACLTPGEVKNLATFAKQLKMEVILEIHDETELGHICNETEMIGINNRNLKSFNVDINRSIELSKQISTDKIKIAESGINNFETIHFLKNEGFKGFLIGEYFMKENNPGKAFKKFVEQLKST